MIKSLLLKISYWINKRYETIEIKHNDLIKYQGQYFVIVKTQLSQEVGCINSLNIEAHEVSLFLDSNKYIK